MNNPGRSNEAVVGPVWKRGTVALVVIYAVQALAGVVDAATIAIATTDGNFNLATALHFVLTPENRYGLICRPIALLLSGICAVFLVAGRSMVVIGCFFVLSALLLLDAVYMVSWLLPDALIATDELDSVSNLQRSAAMHHLKSFSFRVLITVPLCGFALFRLRQTLVSADP